jgi:transcription initiation factor IIE alpha subunit
MARRYICDGCSHAIEAWSDGNPYYIDESGAKQYAYHPDHELLARCIGNDSPHLCLSCGHKFMVDSETPIMACLKCRAREIVDTYQLDGQSCPFCKAGMFTIDPDFHCIS